jgi:hypothetical protein
MRRVPLEPKPPADHSAEPGWREWHQPIWGRCQCCGVPGRLERHHVILAQHVRAEGGAVYDLRNSLTLGRYCRCHRSHHQAAVRLPLSCVPAAALGFAVELLGEHQAAAYLARFYRSE